MDVLFLDFDGVINNCKDIPMTLPMTLHDGHITRATVWSPSCIKPFIELMEWCYDNNISLVISSTWRLTMTVEDFNNYFKVYFERVKMPKVVGLTEVTLYPLYMHRGTEISNYLKNNDVNKWVVVDDDIEDIIDTLPEEHIVKIEATTGLTDLYVEEIKKRFMGD